MPSPIRREVGQLFVPVRDMPQAIAWYGALLGLPTGTATHEDTIYDLPMVQGPGVALDANAPFTAGGPPRFFWWTDDLNATREHVLQLGASDVTDVIDIGSVTFVQFCDPDGNRLMVCEPRA